mmetsp:Transcript_27547/g.89720  ORF Transcript_27547/g.89720 Transcript_27547/m.89720 type:complete len:109 (-) Transcript_27547:128-454(-)
MSNLAWLYKGPMLLSMSWKREGLKFYQTLGCKLFVPSDLFWTHVLFSQREQLKNVHKKVLDVMNTLGVSNSLIRVIEKRQAMDIILLFAGMIGTVFILVMVWIYFRRK